MMGAPIARQALDVDSAMKSPQRTESEFSRAMGAMGKSAGFLSKIAYGNRLKELAALEDDHGVYDWQVTPHTLNKAVPIQTIINEYVGLQTGAMEIEAEVLPSPEKLASFLKSHAELKPYCYGEKPDEIRRIEQVIVEGSRLAAEWNSGIRAPERRDRMAEIAYELISPKFRKLGYLGRETRLHVWTAFLSTKQNEMLEPYCEEIGRIWAWKPQGMEQKEIQARKKLALSAFASMVAKSVHKGEINPQAQAKGCADWALWFAEQQAGKQWLEWVIGYRNGKATPHPPSEFRARIAPWATPNSLVSLSSAGYFGDLSKSPPNGAKSEFIQAVANNAGDQLPRLEQLMSLADSLQPNNQANIYGLLGKYYDGKVAGLGPQKLWLDLFALFAKFDWGQLRPQIEAGKQPATEQWDDYGVKTDFLLRTFASIGRLNGQRDEMKSWIIQTICQNSQFVFTGANDWSEPNLCLWADALCAQIPPPKLNYVVELLRNKPSRARVTLIQRGDYAGLEGNAIDSREEEWARKSSSISEFAKSNRNDNGYRYLSMMAVQFVAMAKPDYANKQDFDGKIAEANEWIGRYEDKRKLKEYLTAELVKYQGEESATWREIIETDLEIAGAIDAQPSRQTISNDELFLTGVYNPGG